MRASRPSPIAFPVTTSRSTRSKTPRVSRTLTSDLFDRIRLDILHCRLQPGSRLLFRDLRSIYGSGQSPLREALMRLASEQLVVLEDHKGFRVAPVSPEEALDIANSRCELEGLAVRMAIRKGDDRWESNIIARFHELSKRATYAADGKLDPEWERRHDAFHQALYAGVRSAIVDVVLPDSRRTRVPLSTSAARKRRSHTRSPWRARGDSKSDRQSRRRHRCRAAAAALHADG